ncbi:hypothetical protein TGAM01_v210058 [Trichoderma gamsii]|uniref:Uncharacterized protein n=1 Tax=Trichoderma gamsii TaxID=398673 RepID=A0A2P4ZA04_9HYPO|nr:hypothetical protein TGAM01_v210058 [Trichoderma gamsii]PON21102.1 hypothetical protein TGAM01_v210058 [Trichoderma gamsii]
MPERGNHGDDPDVERSGPSVMIDSAVHLRVAAIGPLAIWRDSTANGSTAGIWRRKAREDWKAIGNRLAIEIYPRLISLSTGHLPTKTKRFESERRDGPWRLAAGTIRGRLGDESWRCQGLAGQRAGAPQRTPGARALQLVLSPPDWTPHYSEAQLLGAAPIPQSGPHCRLGGTGDARAA